MHSSRKGSRFEKKIFSALMFLGGSNVGFADVESQHNGVNRVYPPYVTALEQEVEVISVYQTDGDPTEDNILHQSISFGTAINAKIFAEVGLSGKKIANGPLRLEGYEIETRIQLTEQGEYAADWGLLLEVDRERSESITEAAVALLVSRQWGDWIGTVNVGVEYEYGSDIANEFDTSFAAQWRYRYMQSFEPGVEFYADEFTRGVGPVLSGVIRGVGNRKWLWESGVIFPLNNTTPDTTFRFLLEYEF